MSQCFEILWREIFFFSLLCYVDYFQMPRVLIDVLRWTGSCYIFRTDTQTTLWSEKLAVAERRSLSAKLVGASEPFISDSVRSLEAIADIVSFLLGRDNTGRLISYEPSIRLHTRCCENPYLCSNASAYWRACCFSICTHCLRYWFALL